ncbi:helicase-related protein [Nonomuraea sp. 10N515B]|uniref:helicase-related protein n=1 Tax=Nonomuraea sp. 10N515B TaxID=3457422 RepID=UPI003FCC4F76
MSYSPLDRPLGREKTRTLLGLTVWEIELAVDVGLLTKTGSQFAPEPIIQALADPASFRERLAAERRLNATEAAESLGITPGRFTRLASAHGLASVGEKEIHKYGRELTVRYWRTSDVESLREAAAKASERLAAQRHRRADREREAAARARVRIAVRQEPPEQVVLHLGPTNSGKTYAAIERLAEHGSGVYVAPLRMLATEVYERLRAKLGRVGLITGEEVIDPDAPVLCCTAEAAPVEADFAVIDEAHWLADPDRGPAWTKLLYSGAYRIIHVVAAPEVEPLLRHLLGEVAVVRHTRSAPLLSGGPWTAGTLPAGSAVVAFGRKAVLALHGELTEAGRSATVLYGALPPHARRAQIARLAGGSVEVIVTTDVVGHGVNLPLNAVAFAETSKFDGHRRRSLLLWEAAQIAGRAGRRGLTDQGWAGLYRSELPGLAADSALIGRAVKAANGTIGTGLAVPHALLAPSWAELGDPTPAELPHALAGWVALARTPPLRPVPVDRLIERWKIIRSIVTRWGGRGREVWRLMRLPVETDSPVFVPIVRAVLCGVPLEALGRGCGDLQAAERQARIARDLRTAVRVLGPLGGITAADAAAAEREAAERINVLLSGKRPLSNFGRCWSCGNLCAPWFDHCDPCFGDYSYSS